MTCYTHTIRDTIACAVWDDDRKPLPKRARPLDEEPVQIAEKPRDRRFANAPSFPARDAVLGYLRAKGPSIPVDLARAMARAGLSGEMSIVQRVLVRLLRNGDITRHRARGCEPYVYEVVP